jgi:hypothetical protein
MKLTILILMISLFTLNSQNKKLEAGVYKWVSNFKSNYPNYDINFEIKKGKNIWI